MLQIFLILALFVALSIVVILCIKLKDNKKDKIDSVIARDSTTYNFDLTCKDRVEAKTAYPKAGGEEIKEN